MLVNCCLIVAVGIYFGFRHDRAGAWPPEKLRTQNPREELGGCIGGFFVLGIAFGVLAGALKLSGTIMLPIVFVSLCIYGLFQLAVYPRLFKALLLFTVITKLPELIGSLLLPNGMQGSPVRMSNILALSVAMPVYATCIGMITAAVLDWRRERRGVATLPGRSAVATDDGQTYMSDDKARNLYQQGMDNADHQNWKGAAKDFAAAVELDRTSPTYVYSLAVARTQCAPTDVGEDELQKYYLDACALFEQAIRLDANRSELDKEAYKKVAYTCGALYRSLKKHEDALRLFRVGLKHHSHDAELLAGAGWSQFDLGQLSDAEKTVSQLLELAPDSNDGRQLWKVIRKAQGQELTSDLSEDLRRQIYQEYLEKKDRSFVQGYMDSGVSSKLSFEELVSDISGKAADADLKVRRSLLEKYGLKEFEFDLILKQGEREAWN
jgi:tetratricopeptide (TPR) repeat protein